MSDAIGARLVAFLSDAGSTSNWTVEPDAQGKSWRLSGKSWRAHVRCDAGRWIGIRFELRFPDTVRNLTYDIDTDNYDISHESQRDFADAIELQVLGFLQDLRNGRVLHGKIGSKLVVIFPDGPGHRQLAQGRFGVVTATTMPSIPSGSYAPVE